MSMALLNLLSLGLFLAFSSATRAYARGLVRQSHEADGRRLVGALDVDLRLGDFATATLVTTRTSGTGAPRHAICLAGVDRWDGPNTFDASRVAPRWNQYVAYYASLETPGRVYRTVLRPASAAEIGPFPLALFESTPGNFLRDDPRDNLAPQTSFRLLLDGVESFKLSWTPGANSLRAELKVLGREGAVYALLYDFFPENSKPRR